MAGTICGRCLLIMKTYISANIRSNFDYDAVRHGKHYIFKQYPFTMTTTMSKRNHKRLMHVDMRAYVLFMRMAVDLRRNWRYEPIDAVTVEVPRTKLNELFNRHIVNKMLVLLEDMAYIKKAVPSQKDMKYYINPNVINCMTTQQAELYKVRHYTLFAPLPELDNDGNLFRPIPAPKPVPVPLPQTPPQE